MNAPLNHSPEAAEKARILAEALPYTLELAVYALVLAVVLAIPIGTAAGTTSSRMADAGMQTLTLLGLSLPAFWVGSVLILIFSVHLRWFPVLSYPPITQAPLANLWGFFLPALTLAVPNAAAIARMVRASLVSVRNEEYIKVARAKGLAETRVIAKHTLRNSAIPIVTLAGLEAGQLLGGAVVTETIFAWPGLGRLTVQALLNRDFPVVLAAVSFTSIIYTLMNLVVDLLYGWLDPRVRRA